MNSSRAGHPRNQFFTGRADLIARIDDPDNKKIVILYGLPGVGKTSVAIEYLHIRSDDQTFTRAYWFDAENKEKIKANLFRYGVENKDSEIGREETITNFIESIKDSTAVLLVFDNVEELQDVVDCIDIRYIECKTIITARNPDIVSDETTKLEVPPFDLIEARQFLKKQLSISSEEHIDNLVEKLRESTLERKTLPYYLVLFASAYTNTDLPAIIEFYNEVTFMERFLEHLNEKCPEAVYLLEYVMLIDLDDIPHELIERILLNRGDYKKAVDLLCRQNLCKMIKRNKDTDNYGINIHRLLHNDLKEHLSKEKIVVIEINLMKILEALFPETKYEPDENWNVADLYYRHVKKLGHVIPSLERDVASRLQYKLSLYEGNVLQKHNSMIDGLLKVALDLMDDDADTKHLKGKAYLNMGIAYSNFQGNETEALKMFKLATETLECIDGKLHFPHLATAYNYIGVTQAILGNYREALESKERALKIRKEIYKDEDHLDITLSYDSIATSYLNLYRTDKALEYCTLSHSMRLRLFKGNNYYLALSSHFIGLVFLYMGYHNTVFEYLNSALQMHEIIYKIKDHGRIAVVISNIGCYYSAIKNESKAFHYKMKSLKMRERLYEGDHIRKTVSIHDVGKSHSNFGNEEEALRYYTLSLEMKKRIFKEENVDFALIHKDIASSFAILGNKDESLKHFDISLEIIKTVHKYDSVYSADIIFEKGQMYSCFDDEEAALDVFMNALDMQQRYFEKKDNRNVVFTLNAISLSYARLGKREKALEYHKLAYDMHSRLFAANGLEKAVLINDLGLVYFYTGEHERAIDIFNNSIEMIKRITEEEAHPDIAASLKYIGLAYSKLGNKTEALKHDELCLKIRKALFTEYLKYFTNSAELETKIFGDSDEQYLRFINYRKSIQYCMI